MSLAAAVDLIGHGAEERLESLLRWLPARQRVQLATTALVVGAGLALIMLFSEAVGPYYRPPARDVHDYGRYFVSGPFLSVGVGLFLAFMPAALLVVRGPGSLARLLLLGAVFCTAWMRWPVWSAAYPTPRLLSRFSPSMSVRSAFDIRAYVHGAGRVS